MLKNFWLISPLLLAPLGQEAPKSTPILERGEKTRDYTYRVRVWDFVVWSDLKYISDQGGTCVSSIPICTLTPWALSWR